MTYEGRSWRRRHAKAILFPSKWKDTAEKGPANEKACVSSGWLDVRRRKASPPPTRTENKTRNPLKTPDKKTCPKKREKTAVRVK